MAGGSFGTWSKEHTKVRLLTSPQKLGDRDVISPNAHLEVNDSWVLEKDTAR